MTKNVSVDPYEFNTKQNILKSFISTYRISALFNCSQYFSLITLYFYMKASHIYRLYLYLQIELKYVYTFTYEKIIWSDTTGQSEQYIKNFAFKYQVMQKQLKKTCNICNLFLHYLLVHQLWSLSSIIEFTEKVDIKHDQSYTLEYFIALETNSC